MTVSSAFSNGITNDRFYGSSLAAAIAAAGVNGYVVAPPGVHTLIEPVTPLAGQTIDLTKATLKHTANTSGFSLVDISASNVTVIGGIYDGNVANQSVWSEQRHAIRIRDASNVKILYPIMMNLIGDGIYISHAAGAVAPYTGSTDVEVAHGSFLGTNLNRNGVSVVCGRGIKIHHNYFYRMATAAMPGAIDLEPNDANDFLYDISVDHNLIDNGAGAVVAVTGIQLANSTANAVMDGISIGHNIIRGDFLRGIRLRGSSSVTERGIKVRGNDIRDITPAAGTNYGIRCDDIQADVSGNTVDGVTGVGIYQIASELQLIGNIIRNATVAGYEQGGASDLVNAALNKVRDCGIGFDLRSSDSDYIGNDVYAAAGMTYGFIFNTGTGNRLYQNKASGATVANFSGMGNQTKRDNLGYLTENTGTGTINSGSTSATVTHGLAETPPATAIRITLRENPTNDPGNIWIDTVGATTFAVNCRNNPGASNLDFAWRVEAD